MRPPGGASPTWVTPAEATKLLSAAEGIIYWFCLVALHTGLRKSNLVGSKYKVGLLWGDLDLNSGTLFIAGDRMKSLQDHWMPLHPELVSELRRLRASLGFRRAAVTRWKLYLPGPIASWLANHTSVEDVTDLYVQMSEEYISAEEMIQNKFARLPGCFPRRVKIDRNLPELT